MIDNNEGLKIYLFLKKSRQDAAGNTPLYARVSINGKLHELNTKIKVPLAYWDQDRQQVLRVKASKISNEIKDLLNKMDDVHGELTSIGGHYSFEKFKFLVFGESTKTPNHTYLSIYQKHLDIEYESIAPGTWKNYRSTHKFFQEYLENVLNIRDIAITKFSRQLMIEFMAWLKKRTPDTGQRLCTVTTAQKHAERLTRLLNFAVEMQYIPFNPVVNLKKKKIYKDRTYLDSEEIGLLENHVFNIHYLVEICDSFLFSCYTGLSYTDIKTLNRSDLIKEINGSTYIAKIREKTKRTREVKFYVPLLPRAVEILQKYSEHPGCLNKNVLLPIRCNQSYNRSLKTIAKIVGIDKILTTHVARHTFATTVTQDNGISLESISEMLGHTQIKTTQIYSRTTLKKVLGEMSNLAQIQESEQKKIIS